MTQVQPAGQFGNTLREIRMTNGSTNSSKTPSRGTVLAWWAAATIFVSAFLLFQVQPIVSKYILPWFGGSPAVWTTCMLFFQTLLFAGYAYAHFCTQRLSPKQQAVLHLGIILTALAAVVFLRLMP